MITFEYNIYRSKNTVWIDRMLSECCFVWNHALALQKRYYRMYGKSISLNNMQKHFAKRIKRNLLHSQTVQEILERLDVSYKRFFKRISKRPPKFKRREKFSSFLFKQGGFKLDGNTIRVNSIKKIFKFSLSRNYEGNVKQVRFKRLKNNRYHLFIVTDKKPDTIGKSRRGASVGIDFGLKQYLTLSDGKKYDNPLFFKKYINAIRLANRHLSRAKRGSNNRKRRLFELSQLHYGIYNARNDFQWKLAHELCRSYDTIFIEDLNIDAMKRLWGRKVSDLAHSSFIDKLIYVALRYGVRVHKIDRFYPSSKTCECGYIHKELSLKDRTWECPNCHKINDRDLLAANNILRRGIYELEREGNTEQSVPPA